MIDLNLDIPKGFLDEEERCGFIVTQKRKEVWAVELDLLNELDRVCKQNNLKYALDGGTLLGVIRHKGFIPWDDDIDVVMLRDDYNKLCEIANDSFNDPYFFQTEYTDPGSFRKHAQIRNSNTTGILKSELKANLKINQGIFIDIFPVDIVSDDEDKLREQVKKLKKLQSTFSKYIQYKLCYHEPENKIKALAKRIYKQTIQNSLNYEKALDAYKQFEKECGAFNNIKNAKFGSLISFDLESIDKYKRVLDSWQDISYFDFEFLKLPVTSDYKFVLEHEYGKDYMTPIKADSCHGGVIFDTNKSYKDYINNA